MKHTNLGRSQVSASAKRT